MTPSQEYDGFLKVVEDHKGIIYKVASSYSRNAEDRKDLVQEIIFQLWKSFEKYQANYMYSTWIYRIALNVAISFVRKAKVRTNYSAPLSDAIIAPLQVETDDTKEQTSKLLHQFIDDLKPLDKALVLLYLDGKSHKEMAAIMGLSETNISTKIHRIKTILKQKFEAIN